MDMDNSLHIKDLVDSINSYSGKVRVYLTTFIIIISYFIVAAVSTEDYDILLYKSIIELPILGSSVKLSVFYMVTPLILVLHYVLLSSLSVYVDKVKLLIKINDSKKEKIEGLILCDSLFFNLLSNFNVNKLNVYILNRIFIFFVLIFPFSLFVIFQWRFSDYHDVEITLVHLFCVILDFFLIGKFYLRNINFDDFVHHAADNVFIFLFFLLSSYMLLKIFGSDCSLFVVFTLAFITFLFINSVWIQKDTLFMVCTLSIFSVSIVNCILFFIVMNTNYLLDDSRFLGQPRSVFQSQLKNHFYPRIHVPGAILSSKYERNQKKYTSKTNWDIRNGDLYLAGRNLKFANFRSILANEVNLSNSNLSQSDFWSADLNRSLFYKADLSWAGLGRVNMRYSNLECAKLINTNFVLGDFSYSSFRYSWAVGAKFYDEYGGKVREGILKGVDFSGAKLDCACMSENQVNESEITLKQRETLFANNELCTSKVEFNYPKNYCKLSGARTNKYRPIPSFKQNEYCRF